jgi:cytochrome c heme-lyase
VLDLPNGASRQLSRESLNTTRQVSSIPKGGVGEADGHDIRWIYPSEQMMFDALRRKNWSPKEHDMRTIVPIHNTVNERAWQEILEWEKLHADTGR